MSAIQTLGEAFGRLQIPFAIGGSLASSAHGAPRSTLDVDVLARIEPQQAGALAECLGSDWYMDIEYARTAIERGLPFNVLYVRSILKFDIFPATSAFHLAEIARAMTEQVTVEGETVGCPVVTAEDILLAKLRWYADGGQSSERQWTDIVTVTRANVALDREYAHLWAARLGVEELLRRAIEDSSP